MNTGTAHNWFASHLKGSVQRKLRWVKNGVNSSLNRGAGHYFFVLVHLHLVLSIFPLPVSTAEFIGEFWSNKRSDTSDVPLTVLAQYRIRYWRYVATCAYRQSGAPSLRQ
jgi:hypothetical protein